MFRVCNWLSAGVLASLATVGIASPTPGDTGIEMAMAADFLAFQYREFDVDGRELNREDGTLPGLRLTLRESGERYFARADVSVHDGSVDYDGETQRGRPFETDTDTRLVSVSAELGGWMGARPGPWGAFVHLARREWERDIRGRDGVQGLFEVYRWTEAGAGVRRLWPMTPGSEWRHELTATAFAVTSGDIDVTLSGLVGSDLDDVTLSLGNEYGARLRYTAIRPLASGRRLWIEPYYEYWEFGRSNTRPVTSNGATTGGAVAEPRSESQRFGVAIGLTF